MAEHGIRRALAVAVVIAVGCATPASPESSDPSDSEPIVPDPRVEPGHPGEAADGPALTREEIRMVVRAKLPQIRACFESAPDDPDEPTLRTRVQLRFTIGPEGKARDIAIDDEPSGTGAGACIAEQLARWQFPRPRGGRSLTIAYPFVYSSEASLRAAGLPRVEGTLTPEAVGAVFDARRSEIDVCIPEGASGTIGVALSIDDAGAVTRISSYADELPDGAGSCVIRTISSWVFPPAASGDEARVNHDLSW